MKLAAKTKLGKESLRQAEYAVAKFCALHRSLDWIGTDNNEPAVIDGGVWLRKDKTLYSIVEIKSRPRLSEELLFGRYGGTWMMAAHKVRRALVLCKSLVVPFVGFLFLPLEGTLLITTIADKRARFVSDVRFDMQVTQSTINGGEKVEEQAFLPMDNHTKHNIGVPPWMRQKK